MVGSQGCNYCGHLCKFKAREQDPHARKGKGKEWKTSSATEGLKNRNKGSQGGLCSGRVGREGKSMGAIKIVKCFTSGGGGGVDTTKGPIHRHKVQRQIGRDRN